jgi:hypothetical protein
MTPRGHVLIAAVGIALTLPARGYAVDHVVLDISPTRIAAPVPAKASKQERARIRALARWRLDGRVVGRDFYRPDDAELFGVTLTRVFAKGRELHALRAAPTQTVAFDGERGRLEATFGKTLVVRMDIVPSGPAHPVEAPLPCRGNFAQVAVTLRGSFVLRTGTKFFRTIRRVSLIGALSFATGGLVDCTPQVPTACDVSSVLSASTRRPSGGLPVTLLMSPDAHGWTTLSFADRSAASAAEPTATWYDVMYALGTDPLSGQLPTITARMSGRSAIQGNGTFTAQQTSTTTSGNCRSVVTTGTFNGTFRTSFAGWGARTVRFTAADGARYSEQREFESRFRP